MFSFSELFLRSFFPQRCVRCRTWDTPLCKECAQALFSVERQVFPHGSVFELFSLAEWKNPHVRSLIHDIKFFGVRNIVSCLPIGLFANVVSAPYDAILPVPLHPRRERERGFSQSVLLARVIGSALHLPVFQDVLLRTRYTKSQATLPHSQRRRNMTGAFSVRPAYQKKEVLLPFCAPLLVDDVWTTGATMREAASVLRKGGCRTVSAIVVARAG